METVYRRHFSAFILSHWHIYKLRWWMDLSRDLEKNGRMTFLIWRMIVSPRVQCTVGIVSKIRRYLHPVPTVFTRITFSLRNTLCNMKDSSCWFKHNFSYLTGTWIDVINPTFSFQSPGCPLFPIQWIPKGLDQPFFLFGETEYSNMTIYRLQCQFMLILK